MRKEDEKKRTVVVVSRYWPTALGVIRSLGMAGYPVDLIASAQRKGASRVAGASGFTGRYVETVYRNVKREDDPQLMDRLLWYEGKYKARPILFPTDDYTASFIDRHRERLKEVFVMPGAAGETPGALAQKMNKHLQNGLAREAGLLCPAEWEISLEDEILIPEDMRYPCFCKPIESFSGFKGEMKKCDDPRKLRSHLLFLKGRNPSRSILVQEYLDIDEEINLCGVSAGQEVIIPGIIRKARVAEHERGVAVAGRLHPAEELGELQGPIERFVRSMGYTGMFDMDLHRVGEKIYFGELNLRSGGTSYAYYLGGVNLPELTVKYLLGEAAGEEEKQIRSFGRTFAYEKVLWKEYTEGYLKKKDLERILQDADDLLIGDERDPEPGKIFRRDTEAELRKKKKKRLKRSLGRILRPVRTRAEALRRGYPQMKPGNARGKTAAHRVMIIGRNYSSNLCMARSLGLAGYDVEVLRIVPGKVTDDTPQLLIPEAYSRYVKAFYTCPQKSGQIAGMLRKLADPKGRMLLLPTEDVAAYILDEHLEELQPYYYLPDACGAQGEIIRLMSKNVQKELALEAGLPVLDSRMIRISGGRFELPEGISYPCFIKPDVSRRTSKKRMKKCCSEAELREAMEEIASTADLDILVEEYADIRRELSLLGLSYHGESICPGLFEATSESHGARKGVAATGRSIPSNEIDSLRESIYTFMERSGYNGLFDIDFLETTEGKIVFIELNLRCGASGYVLTRSGVNLPGILADHILQGRPIPPEDVDVQTGKTFVSEKVLMEEYAEHLITKDQMNEMIERAEIRFIGSEEDPKPYRYLLKTIGI